MWYRITLRLQNRNPGIVELEIAQAIKREVERDGAPDYGVVEVYADHVRDDVVLYFSEGAWAVYGQTGGRPDIPDDIFDVLPPVQGRRRSRFIWSGY